MSEINDIIEKCLSQILIEMAHSYPMELNVYDFDDTLFKSSSTVFVLNKLSGERKELHPHEYHEYHLQDHEEFDFEDFDQINEPVPLPALAKMKEEYERLGPHGVSICTARPDANPIIPLISKHGMPDIEIVAVGDPRPRTDVGKLNSLRKKNYLKNKILQRGLKVLRFYDDNKDNISAAQSLKAEFPDVKIDAVLVSF